MIEIALDYDAKFRNLEFQLKNGGKIDQMM